MVLGLGKVTDRFLIISCLELMSHSRRSLSAQPHIHTDIYTPAPNHRTTFVHGATALNSRHVPAHDEKRRSVSCVTRAPHQS